MWYTVLLVVVWFTLATSVVLLNIVGHGASWFTVLLLLLLVIVSYSVYE